MTVYIKVEDEDDVGTDDPIDEHVFKLTGVNLDGTVAQDPGKDLGQFWLGYIHTSHFGLDVEQS